MTSPIEMDVDQILGNNVENIDKASKIGEKIKNSKLLTAQDCTKKECQKVRETMIDIHDKIREGMKEMKQQIVSEVLHSICPVLEEIKGTLNELAPKIENLENKSDSELSESEDEEEEKDPSRENKMEERPVAHGSRGENVRENHAGTSRENRGENARDNRGGNRGRPRGRAQNEQYRNSTRGRYTPYQEENHRYYRNNDGNPRYHGRR
uniref:Uncharacterized protein n=1 Tax=Meloidogyne javanica TaxID=6303 RepID=A0A915M0T8_MELJA